MDKDNVGEADSEKVILDEAPLIGMRRLIAKRMGESLQKSPQATITTKADMSALMALKESYLNQGQKLTYTDIFIKVTACALKSNPILNASNQDGKIIHYKSINIGIAIGTDKALYVPVIKNADEKSLIEVSKKLKELINKVNERKITSEDVTGGTFTISNMGMFDLDVMTPIINIPEAAILCIGTTRKELIVEADDSVKIKPMTTLSLTLDHAVMDGIPSAKFLGSFKSIMANPSHYF